MNERFSMLEDGTAAEVEMARVDPEGQRIANATECVEVYWPFALSGVCGAMFTITWDVSHLPSGYLVAAELSRLSALALIDMLRNAGLDYSFTEPDGPKWLAVKKPMGDIARKFSPRMTA